MPLVCSEKYANQTPTHTMCLTDHPNATEVHLSEEVKQQIVDHHNRLRANVDPPPANMQKMVNLLHSLLLLHGCPAILTKLSHCAIRDVNQQQSCSSSSRLRLAETCHDHYQHRFRLYPRRMLATSSPPLPPPLLPTFSSDPIHLILLIIIITYICNALNDAEKPSSMCPMHSQC